MRLLQFLASIPAVCVLGRAVRYRKLRKQYRRLILDSSSRVRDTTFGDHVLISERCELYRSNLGSHTYVAEGTCINDSDLGKFCSIGPRSMIGLAQHPSRGFVSTHPAFYLSAPHRNLDFVHTNRFAGFVRTTIGNDVWLGANTNIKGGLTIGDGAIVGAGAVVTKDVPPYAIVAGVPARIIRFRFTEDQIVRLQRFKWWDRDESWLIKHVELFADADQFLDRISQSTASAGEEPSYQRDS